MDWIHAPAMFSRSLHSGKAFAQKTGGTRTTSTLGWFWAEDRGELARLWLEDNGIGIPADQQERAFRVFERLHGARYVGTGIGLSIVRKGVERMGGLVGLASAPGKGSRFWIELPRAS